MVFHNGGGYDFHFLRYIATMGSPVSRAPREELGEDSDNEGTESDQEGSEPERPMPMAKAAPKPKAAPRPLSGWCALCRPRSSRATTATSMNVFPTSLASMIDDLRACTHKQLPELFPLMASLHPELQLHAPTGSPPQRRPLKQRRTRCELEQAWDCIDAQAAHALRALLRRRGVGDARGVGAALLRQRAGGESGRGPPETFREFHDC